jgi:hypothetical protein
MYDRMKFNMSYRVTQTVRCNMPTKPQTIAVSVRLPKPLLQEATELQPESKISEVVVQALAAWVAEVRREHEDDVIRQALASIPAQQKKEEHRLAEMAGKSSLRTMERTDG